MRHYVLLVMIGSLLWCENLLGDSLKILQSVKNGGQTQLDVSHSYFWRFSYSGSTAYSPITAAFSMKKGSTSASSSAVLRLYSANGDGSNHALLKEISRSGASFSSSSFKDEVFTIFSVAEATVLPSHFNISLTSDAPDSGNEQFFLKGSNGNGDFKFQNGGGGQITEFTNGGGTFSSVPEPSVFVIGGVVLLAMCLSVRRSRRSGALTVVSGGVEQQGAAPCGTM
ncbi:MAG: hypothetical protein RIT02_798 [Planctomycetota bacterium]